MAVHYRTQGFVLKKNDLGEADQIFTIFTKDFGKLKILGKAIRKIKSKLRAGIGPFYLSEIEFIQGKNHKTLTDAAIITKFENIKKDLDKLETIQRITETLDELVKGEEKDDKIWDLLSEAFEKLNNHKPQTTNYKLINYYFLWNLLSILGYQIDLYNCANCQKKLTPKKLYFNPEEGIICENCSGGIKDKDDISPDVIKILRLFTKKDWQTLSRLKIKDSHQKELESISESAIIKI